MDMDGNPTGVMRIWQWIKRTARWIASWLQRFYPGPRTRKGAVIGVFTLVLLGSMYAYSDRHTNLGLAGDLFTGFLVGALTIGGMWIAIALGLTILRRIPLWFPGALFLAIFLLLEGALPGGLNLVAIAMVFAAAVIGGTVMVVTDPTWREAKKGKRIAIPLATILSVTFFVLFFIWLGDRGSAEDLVKVEDPVHRPVTQIDAPDPSLTGSFPVISITYGSGDDRRPEFGEDVDLLTGSIDAKPYVGRLSGRKGRLRNKYWGFDRRAFPLNGRVWYPEGEGPFPLVLIVHGNHSMRDYSDPGYAYLGEHLASHGYIFVSVDENFINGDWSKNYSTESDGRGWILLEHLRQWREWNAEEDHLFNSRVDLDRIVLIGHSRGGEAVAVAAAFNDLSHYPDDASVEFDYGFNIRGIIGIAPVDGQYTPADQRTPLNDINYFLLHGSHDGDVSSFSSDRQYKRLRFTGDEYHFKSSIYIYRANHGQFNSVWGDSDWGKPGAYLLNREEFITGEEQRQIAKVYIHAFLDVVLKENQEYQPLFSDFRTGAQWLPETYYINRFEDSNTRFIADFDEDIDVTTTTVDGGIISSEGLADWKEKDLRFRGNRGDRDNQVVYLGWRSEDSEEESEDADGKAGESEESEEAEGTEHAEEPTATPATYTVTLPTGLGVNWSLDADSDLLFSMAEPDAKPSKPDTSTVDEDPKEKRREEKRKKREEKKEQDQAEQEEQAQGEQGDEPAQNDPEASGEEGGREGDDEKAEEDEEEKPRTPLDLTIRVVDASGEMAAIPLSEVVRLLPPLKTTFMRLESLEDRFPSSSEATLQSIAVPMAWFVEINPRFSPRSIHQIEFCFDRSEQGVILLDEVGFRKNR
ncbi:alpha/beta hydrolase family protein [Gemmatimonadota bacterium]